MPNSHCKPGSAPSVFVFQDADEFDPTLQKKRGEGPCGGKKGKRGRYKGEGEKESGDWGKRGGEGVSKTTWFFKNLQKFTKLRQFEIHCRWVMAAAAAA